MWPNMVRLLLLLAVFSPLVASAGKSKPKKPDVEIWPPPAPGTDQAGNPEPKPEKKPAPEPDAGNPLELDPELTESPSERPSHVDDAKPADDEPTPDRCDEDFDDCKEDCSIAHTNDDTLHVKPGQKLPVQKCVSRCKQKHETCEEQLQAGFKDRNDDN